MNLQWIIHKPAWALLLLYQTTFLIIPPFSVIGGFFDAQFPGLTAGSIMGAMVLFLLLGSPAVMYLGWMRRQATVTWIAGTVLLLSLPMFYESLNHDSLVIVAIITGVVGLLLGLGLYVCAIASLPALATTTMKQEITVLGCGAQQHDATITGCGGTYSKSQERLVRTVTIACLSPWIIWGVCAAVNCTYYEITTPHQVKLNHRFAELLNEPFESKKIRACIEAGADVNTNSNHGTALSIACKSQDESLVAFLLAHHADVNGPGDVLSAAIGQHDCTCNGEIKATPVRERIAVSLLSHGAKIDAKHNKGALVGAVAGNYSLKLVKDTISAGADVSESAGNIGTPVMAAITNGRIDVLELLLQHQPELDRVIWETKRPGTAVHAAVHKGNARAVRMLAAAGANVNLKDSKGRTALSYAREKQLVDVEKTLLALGAK